VYYHGRFRIRRSERIATLSPPRALWPQSTSTALILLSLAALGMLGLAHASALGIGVSPDSVAYVHAARSFLAGQGLTTFSPNGGIVPMTQVPPVYPVLLASVAALGVDVALAAKWLSILLFGVTIVVTGAAVRRSTRSLLLSAFGGLLMLTSYDMLYVHSWAWTEPLFIALGLLALLLLAEYVEHPSLRRAVAAAIVVAIAFLTRYTGAALLITGFVAIVLADRGTRGIEWADVAAFLAVACGPMLLWLAWSIHVGAGVAHRSLAWHPPTLRHVASAVDTVWQWLLPGLTPLGLGRSLLAHIGPAGVWAAVLSCALAVGLLLLAGVRWASLKGIESGKWLQQPAGRVLCLSALYCVAYGGLLIASISLLDASTPVDVRILSPLYPAILVGALCLVHEALRRRKGDGLLRSMLVVTAIALAGAQVARGAAWITSAHGSGLGYANVAWQRSEAVEYVRSLDPGRPIFSNRFDALYFLTGKPAIPIPRKANPITLRTEEGYAGDMLRMGRALEASDGVLVYFSTTRWYMPSAAELQQELHVEPLLTFSDGVAYGSIGR